MRECIERLYRESLNETVGDSFLFTVVRQESGKIDILPRDDEFKTPTKEYTIEQSNARTMVTSKVVTIVRDKDREFELIPEFKDDRGDDDDYDDVDDISRNNEDDE